MPDHAFVFSGTLDNADGLTIRKESKRDFYAFNIFSRDDANAPMKEMEVSISANLMQELAWCQFDGDDVCRVRVTIEVLP